MLSCDARKYVTGKNARKLILGNFSVPDRISYLERTGYNAKLYRIYSTSGVCLTVPGVFFSAFLFSVSSGLQPAAAAAVG